MELRGMNLGIERAFNAQIMAGNKSQNIRQSVVDAAGKVEAILLPFIAKVNDIEGNPSLTAHGKQGELKLAQGVVRGQLAVLDPRGQLRTEQARVDGEIVNAVVRAKGFTKSGERLGSSDPIVILTETIQAQEIRQFFAQHRKDGREAHQKRMEQARKQSIFLDDEERIFEDPLEKSFLAACKDFTPEAKAFINAIERTPYGVKMLDDSIIEHGNELLKQSVAGGFCDVRNNLEMEVQCLDHVFAQAADIASKLKSNQPLNQPYIATPDHVREAVGAEA